MAREGSPCVNGEFWLDKRRDGRTPDIWQVATYVPGTRQVRYRSTGKRDLDAAIGFLHAHAEEQRAKKPQQPEDAKVVPFLFLYWKEKGKDADSAAQIASSIRQFIGFLMQDEATTDLTISGLDKGLWDRFIAWRKGPHSYDVPWAGKEFKHSSPGVSGEAISRNLDDIRAALNHQVDRSRVPFMPKVHGVAKEDRSEPRDLVLTREQMGAIIGYAAHDIRTLRWILAMVATAARPEALLAMQPQLQAKEDFRLLDLHPPKWRRTKKVNPVVPVIPEFQPWLRAWADNPHPPVLSRKIWWRHMRELLELPPMAVPKTIRHTVATRMRLMRVPAEEVETQLGHLVPKKTTRVYAKYDPDYLANAAKALSTIFADYCTAAKEWLAVHLLSTPKRGQKLTVVKNGGIPLKSVVGADGLEPPTLSV